MLNHRLDFRGVPRSFLLATSIMILLFSLESAYGSAYSSLSLEPRTTVTSPSVILQKGTAGTSTIYQSNTSAKVNVANASFGYETAGVNNNFTDNVIRGSKYSLPEAGKAESITAYIKTDQKARNMTCAIYDSSLNLVGSTVQLAIPENFGPAWQIFNFTDPKPSLSAGNYWLVNWGSSDAQYGYIYYDAGDPNQGLEVGRTYDLFPDPLPTPTYTNKKYSIYSTVNYNYVLKVNNTAVTNSWQIRLKKYADANINRLKNCTIYFHNSSDGTSRQIYIQNGWYTNHTGPWYNVGASATVYIAMTVETNSTATSYLRTYLEILIPSTTTYAQYIIEFEIT